MIILQNILIMFILFIIYLAGMFICGNKKEVLIYHSLITIIIMSFSTYVYYAHAFTI